MKTDYHAKYYAYELTKKCSSESLEKFAKTLSEAKVQLNPHQIDAALFAVFNILKSCKILYGSITWNNIKRYGN